jgi:hypothetical protein
VESLIYQAFLNAKAPLNERGFFMLGQVRILADRVSSPSGDGDRHPRPFIILPDACGDALHILHVAAQYLADFLASGMVAGHA